MEFEVKQLIEHVAVDGLYAIVLDKKHFVDNTEYPLFIKCGPQHKQGLSYYHQFNDQVSSWKTIGT